MVDRTCERCGERFSAQEYAVRKGYGRFCSMSCYRESVARKAPKCAGCGKPFDGKPGTKHCSTECRYAGRIKNKPRPCAQCGAIFKPKGAGSRYCSLACFGLAERTRSSFSCENCGSTYERRQYEIGSWNARFCSRACKVEHLAARTEKPCKRCGELLPMSEFWGDALRSDGRQIWCKSCAREHRNTAAPLPVPEGVTTKACIACRRDLPFEAFSSHKLGRFGLRSECRACRKTAREAYMTPGTRSRKNASARARRLLPEVRAADRAYRQRHRALPDVRAHDRDYREKKTAELADSHVAKTLGLPLRLTPRALIEAKRAQLLLYRELKRRGVKGVRGSMFYEDKER